MVKNKNNQTIWNTRIKNSSSNLSQKIGSSIDIDKRLYKDCIEYHGCLRSHVVCTQDQGEL